MKMTNLLLLAIVTAAALYGMRHVMSPKSTEIISESVIPVTIEQTCALIKPDAVAAGHAPEIIRMIEEHGFTIVNKREFNLPREAAEKFYAVHRERPFFNELVEFMTSGPIIALQLQRENAVAAWRELMGATNPANAAEGTIRNLFGQSVTKNAVHGSDSAENAQIELAQIFSEPNVH